MLAADRAPPTTQRRAPKLSHLIARASRYLAAARPLGAGAPSL